MVEVFGVRLHFPGTDTSRIMPELQREVCIPGRYVLYSRVRGARIGES